MRKKITVLSVIGGLISILVLYGILFKTYDYFVCTYATRVALAQVDKKTDDTKKDLEIYTLVSYIRELQKQIWDLQDRLEKKPSDTTAKQTLRKYIAEKDDVQKQIDDMKKK